MTCNIIILENLSASLSSRCCVCASMCVNRFIFGSLPRIDQTLVDVFGLRSMWQVHVNNVPNHRWQLPRKAFLGGQTPPNGRPLSRPPQARRAPPSSLWSAAVAASEGQCLGSCPRSAKISMSNQDDFGQGPACSALAMDPKPLEARWRSPLTSICLGSMANAEHAGP